MGDRIKKLIERNTTHGLSKTNAYEYWTDLVKRARKGQIHLEESLFHFENFYRIVGNRPEGYVIGRKDISKDFTADNILWIPRQESEKPKKHSIIIEYQGESHTATWWGRKLKLKPETIIKRFKAGLPLEQVFIRGRLKTKKSPTTSKQKKGEKPPTISNQKESKQLKLPTRAKPKNTVGGRPRVPTVFAIVGEEAHATLKDGSVIRIDKTDLELVNKYNWRINKAGYVETSFSAEGKSKRFFLHRMLMGITNEDWRKVQCDHKDNNPLNNTRANLRLCTSSQNQINRSLRRDNKTGYTGVYKEGNRWYACLSGKRIKGTFATKEEAFEARKNLEVQIYQAFSKFFEEE